MSIVARFRTLHVYHLSSPSEAGTEAIFYRHRCEVFRRLLAIVSRCRWGGGYCRSISSRTARRVSNGNCPCFDEEQLPGGHRHPVLAALVLAPAHGVAQVDLLRGLLLREVGREAGGQNTLRRSLLGMAAILSPRGSEV